MMRTFLALDLPEEVRGALRVLQFLLPLPSEVPQENFHLTLSFFGNLPERTLEAVHDHLLAIHLPAFELTLAGAGLFGGAAPRAAWAGVAPEPALLRLQSKVETAARRGGATIAAHNFVPHVTLGRFSPPLPEERLRLERAIVSNMAFRAGPFPVVEFVLYSSVTTTRGRRYDALFRYPLSGSAAAYSRK
jgi:RNA 2',3'-cyclic 3'-phosphodiesterase